MSLHDIENRAKRLLEPFPGVKRAGKRVYQYTGYALSRNKIKSEGELVRLTPDDGMEYFFGYYDKCPWDADDRRLLALRVRDATKSPAPKEPGELVLIEPGGAPRVIATVHAWNVQQGCMAQWLGPDFRRRILFNDFREGRYCSVIYDTESHGRGQNPAPAGVRRGKGRPPSPCRWTSPACTGCAPATAIPTCRTPPRASCAPTRPASGGWNCPTAG